MGQGNGILYANENRKIVIKSAANSIEFNHFHVGSWSIRASDASDICGIL